MKPMLCNAFDETESQEFYISNQGILTSHKVIQYPMAWVLLRLCFIWLSLLICSHIVNFVYFFIQFIIFNIT